MAEKTNERQIGNDSRHPRFIWVVVISAVTLLFIFMAAFFLVGSKGRKLLPPRHPDPHPTSQMVPGGVGPLRSSL